MLQRKSDESTPLKFFNRALPLKAFVGSQPYPLQLIPLGKSGSTATIHRSAPAVLTDQVRDDVEIFFLSEEINSSQSLVYKLFQLPSPGSFLGPSGHYRALNHDKEERAGKIRRKVEDEVAMLKQGLGLTEQEVKLYEAKNLIGYLDTNENLCYEVSFNPEAIGYYLYSMPFYQGYELSQVLEVNRGLSLNFIVILMQKIIDEIKAIHKRGVAHCDLSPANIILTDVPLLRMLVPAEFNNYLQQVNVRVVDFGCAKKMEGGEKVLLSSYDSDTGEFWVNTLLRSIDNRRPNNMSLVQIMARPDLVPAPKTGRVGAEVVLPWLDEFGLVRCMALLLNSATAESVTMQQMKLINHVFMQIVNQQNRLLLAGKRIEGIIKLERLLHKLSSTQCTLDAPASLFFNLDLGDEDGSLGYCPTLIT